MLVIGSGGEDRRAVAGRRARGIAAVPDEIALHLAPRPQPCCRPWRRRGSRPIRGRSRSAPSRPPAAPPNSCAAGCGALRSRRTAASFHPRLKASCIETFMPWPAFGLWVWQASPAMNTRGRRGRARPPARRRTCRSAAGRSRRPTTRRPPSPQAYGDGESAAPSRSGRRR